MYLYQLATTDEVLQAVAKLIRFMTIIKYRPRTAAGQKAVSRCFCISEQYTNESYKLIQTNTGTMHLPVLQLIVANHLKQFEHFCQRSTKCICQHQIFSPRGHCGSHHNLQEKFTM
jgi:hypothetical protein